MFCPEAVPIAKPDISSQSKGMSHSRMMEILFVFCLKGQGLFLIIIYFLFFGDFVDYQLSSQSEFFCHLFDSK